MAMNYNSVSIKKADLSDLDALVQLTANTFTESWLESDNVVDINTYVKECFSEEQLALELKDPSIRYLFILVDKVPVGYMKVQRNAQPDGHLLDSPMALHRIYIKKEYQGNKFGARLIHEAIVIARKEGCKHLWLGVWNENQRAIKLYASLGFRIFGNYQFVMGTIISDDYLMKLMIEEV